MKRFADKALGLLADLPDSESLESLKALVHYTIDRKK
jgi:geranylgeranyl pyrophosphate synthase